MDKTGGQAFPLPDLHTSDGGAIKSGHPGMTLRDWFAGRALDALLASDYEDPMNRDPKQRLFTAQRAYEYADAMIKARSEEG